MTEAYTGSAQPNGMAFPGADGPFYPAPGSSQARGFRASEILDLDYDLNPYVDVKGTIPYPTQERIDAFMEAGGLIEVEIARLQHEADVKQRKANAEKRKAMKEAAEKGEEYIEPFNLEKLTSEVKEALSELHRYHDVMRDHLAGFCKGKPTRKQLDKLPDPIFRQFYRYVGSQINPEG